MAAPVSYGWIEKGDHALRVAVKMKLDTGALTSSLDARELHHFKRDGKPWVRFTLALTDANTDKAVRQTLERAGGAQRDGARCRRHGAETHGDHEHLRRRQGLQGVVHPAGSQRDDSTRAAGTPAAGGAGAGGCEPDLHGAAQLPLMFRGDEQRGLAPFFMAGMRAVQLRQGAGGQQHAHFEPPSGRLWMSRSAP